jgi:hypothetical protein
MRSLLLAILLFLTVSLHSQTYHPFPDSGAVWDVQMFCCGGDPIISVWNYSLEIKGDTTFEGKFYQKVYESPEKVIGGIREDSLKRVYFTNFRDSVYDNILSERTIEVHKFNEVLIFDFSVVSGDSFSLTDSNALGSSNWVMVDSVLTFGSYRKRISVNFNGGNDTWIEGMGSLSSGVLGPLVMESLVAVRLCRFAYGADTLVDPREGCMLSDTKVESSNSSFSIHPNPITSSSVLTIEYPNQFQFTMEIVDLQGRVIASRKIANRFSLSEVNLDSGIYLVRIKSNDEVLGTDRIVKME